MSWGTIALIVWMGMYALRTLTNFAFVHMDVVHGIVAAVCAIAIAFGK